MHIKKNILTFSSLLLLTACANYSASSLNSLSHQTAIQREYKQEVAVSWKFFNKEASEKYLGRDVLSEGYIPLQVTIQNNSSDPLLLSANNFNIPSVGPEEVGQAVHTSTSARVIAWGVPGLLFWPLLIPAFYEGIKSNAANEALDRDYLSKSLKEQVISPHCTCDKLIFFQKKDVAAPIEMFLLNQRTNNKISFSLSEGND